MIDSDIQGLLKHELKAEIMRLRNAIRYHRDQKGHDRCWLDDATLYGVLPEYSEVDFKLPPKCEFLENCELYWINRQPKEE